MHTSRFRVAVLAVLLSMATGCDDEPPLPPPLPPDRNRPPDFAVGQWTTHRLTRADGESSELTYAIVDQERDGVLWIEVETTTARGPVHIQILLDVTGVEWSDPERAHQAEIEAVKVRLPNGRVQTFRGAMLRMTREMYGRWSATMFVGWSDEQREDVTVAAGTFRQTYKRQQDTRFGPWEQGGTVWHHSAVPITGMVKMVSDDGTTMELVDFGMTGAESDFD